MPDNPVVSWAVSRGKRLGGGEGVKRRSSRDHTLPMSEAETFIFLPRASNLRAGSLGHVLLRELGNRKKKGEHEGGGPSHSRQRLQKSLRRGTSI